MAQCNNKSGFLATGISPFDPHVLPIETFASSNVTDNSIEPPNQYESSELSSLAWHSKEPVTQRK